jgi:hypothetical protein
MVKGYVSQTKTLKTTGDITLAVEVVKDLKSQVMEIDHETVYVLSEAEWNAYMEILHEGGCKCSGDCHEAKA